MRNKLLKTIFITFIIISFNSAYCPQLQAGKANINFSASGKKDKTIAKISADSESDTQIGESRDAQFVPGQLIVKLKEEASLSDLEELNAQFSVTSMEKVFPDISKPEETLEELKDKLSKLSPEHQNWYWQLDKDSVEYKDYVSRLDKEKEKLEKRIKALEDLITRLERRQERAPDEAVAPNLDNIYILQTNQNTDILQMAQVYIKNPYVE